MFRRYFNLLLLVLLPFFSSAQSDSSHLRITLLTCGTGLQPWETFGHTAIRVTDSVRGLDDVFNYGTFEFGDDFLVQFTRGKLLYYLSYYPYRAFLEEYAVDNRSVHEQELYLEGKAKQAIYEFLQWNALDENKYYKYDFFFDNCATRLRDVFPKALGEGFHYGNVLPEGQKLTYRHIINQYFYRVHWQRFGVNILLGSKIDKVMTNEEIMFLPDFLRDGVLKANLNGRKISGEPVQVVPGGEKAEAGINGAFLLTLGILLLTVAGLFVDKLRVLGNVMTRLLFFITGLIGCFIVVMWLATDHQACQNNYNLLWALPTNIFLVFSSNKNKSRYVLLAIPLIGVSLLLHILKVQELPLLELSPLLLALLLSYGMIYRKTK